MAIDKTTLTISAVGVTLTVLIAMGFLVSIDDTHYCKDLTIGMKCDHLSSTEKTCYPSEKTTIGKKYCATGWLLISKTEPYVTCDYIEKEKVIYINQCGNVTVINKTDKTGFTTTLYCYPVSLNKTYIECTLNSEKILYHDSILEPDKYNIRCNTTLLGIFCDDKVGGDGNGDGICQSGETCYEFALTDKIENPIITNGDIVVKKDGITAESIK